MRKAIFGLGCCLIAACGGSQTEGDSESGSAAASAGEDSASGGSESNGGSGKGGSAGPTTGGVETGGNPSGGSDRGGNAQGGEATGGSSGDGVGESGGAGITGGTSGSSSGEGGTSTAGRAGGGASGSGNTDPVCDPSSGEHDNTPYPDCEPRDANDACELCIEASCCEESKKCYAFDPGNVCGWGGPTGGDSVGEIDCYVLCAREYVDQNGVYDADVANLCVPACTTEGCGLIGNATMDVIVCMEGNCEEECFAP